MRAGRQGKNTRCSGPYYVATARCGGFGDFVLIHARGRVVHAGGGVVHWIVGSSPRGRGRVVHRVPTRTGVRFVARGRARPGPGRGRTSVRRARTDGPAMSAGFSSGDRYGRSEHRISAGSHGRPLRPRIGRNRVRTGPSIGHKSLRVKVLPRVRARPSQIRDGRALGATLGAWKTAGSGRRSGRFAASVDGANATLRRGSAFRPRRFRASSEATSTRFRFGSSGTSRRCST